MDETRELVRKAVEHDLLAADGLLAEREPVPPPGYALRHLIGRGGGGAVYLADDLTLQRPVAVKFLNDTGPAVLERFRREARFTARLDNPSIVKVYELGEVGAQPYIAMQYVDGHNLGEADLPIDGVVGVIRQIASALHHAHAEGIVHRDIKPENILLDRAGRAYLTDFGIARSLRSSISETISREGQIIGTPALMSPEQARGEVQAVDARSDVYSLGATAYSALTGHYPFDATNVVDLLHAVIHEEAPLPRSRRASIPRALEAIIVRCMQKCRDDRYQSMAELIEDLDRLAAGQEAVGGPWLRKLVSTVDGAPDPPPRRDDVASDPGLIAGMEVVRSIASWDADLYRVSGSLSPSFERLDGIRARLEQMLAERPDTAWARFYRGVVLFRRGRLHEALEDMERAIDRVGDVSGASFELGRLYLALYLKEHRLAHKHISREGVEFDLASVRGRLDQAVLALREAKRLDGHLPRWYECYSDAVARLAESDYAGCIRLCDEILREEPDVEQVWKLRGDAQQLAGDDPFESFERALDVRRTYFEALHAKAEAHLRRGDVPEARSALERALEIHPQFADAAALLARTYLHEGRGGPDRGVLEEGRSLAERALALDECSYDAAVTLAELELELGVAAADDGLLVSALRRLDRAADLPGCPNRVNLLRARTHLARARRAAAGNGDASEHLRAAGALCAQANSMGGNDPWREISREVEAAMGAAG